MTQRHYLVDVDVDGVHLVGEPANQRKFALVKNLAGKKPEGVETMEELLKALKGVEEKDLAGIVDALGKEKLAKTLGVELPKPPATPPVTDSGMEALDKAKLPAEVRAYVEQLEAVTKATDGKLDQLLKEREAERKTALQKRAKILKDAGYEVDVEKVTEPEIAALEKAAQQIEKRLQEAGIFVAKGSAKEEEDAGLLGAVRKEVRNQLGREPIDSGEEAQELRKVLRGHPGMLADLLRAEREDRAA